MSKAVLICSRDRGRPHEYDKVFRILNQRLSPDNIDLPPPLVLNKEGISIAVFNPHSSLIASHMSVCLGNLIGQLDDWWKPMAEIADGSYALFRSDQDSVELVTDTVASRSIWYIHTEKVLIASSSQRVIVSLLGSFKPNRNAFAWMLSSGTLGPGYSWDQRIKLLGPDTRLLLHRQSWAVTLIEKRPELTPLKLSMTEHKRQLKQALDETFEQLEIDYSKWILPLSGGGDSRAILLSLKNKENLRCVTWGLKSSLQDEMNDACIAERLAQHFNVNHRYFETDISDESMETLFNRFLVSGEGRIDHISAYMDGFAVWKTLFEEGNAGIIRGDQGFTSEPVYTARHIRRYIGLLFLSDYSNLKSYKRFELPEQVIPEHLIRKKGESLIAWRDRLYHEFRMPAGFAALNELKCIYVDVINPLLSRRIIEQIRLIPPSLTAAKKQLWKELIRDISPPIPFALRSATASTRGILRTTSVVDLIIDEMKSARTENVLPRELTRFICESIEPDRTPSSYISKSSKAKLMSDRILHKFRRLLARPEMNTSTFAFRAYIVSKMTQTLLEDAKLSKQLEC